MPRILKIYSPDEIRQRLAGHTDWSLGDDNQLHASYTLKNFAQVMLFVNAIAHLAETANHHPDLLIHDWKHLTISLMTHDQGGITDLDLNLIQQIDALPRYAPA
ncbi:MAG: 4a-hydroxytetrahydrobiopterin dehydratase [Chloroflexi bacterium]|nr:4a-hydroxytetrahydrobiopterin dehydratase [Chloroflexota bacterium]